MTTPTTGDQSEPPYKPSPELAIALADWKDAVAQAERLRHAARRAVAQELRETGELNRTIANHPLFPWTEETVRGIAREYDTPRQRAPQTPRSPKKSPAPKKPRSSRKPTP